MGRQIVVPLRLAGGEHDAIVLGIGAGVLRAAHGHRVRAVEGAVAIAEVGLVEVGEVRAEVDALAILVRILDRNLDRHLLVPSCRAHARIIPEFDTQLLNLIFYVKFFKAPLGVDPRRQDFCPWREMERYLLPRRCFRNPFCCLAGDKAAIIRQLLIKAPNE